MDSMADIARVDLNTFPKEDPKKVAKRQKEIKKARGEEKRDRVAEAREVKALEKKKAAGTKAAPVTLDDAARERVVILRKLTQYYAKLGHKISVSKPRSYPSDLRKLKELLLAVETDLAANGGIEQAGAMYVQGVAVVEQLAPLLPFGLQLSGPQASLSGTVRANQEIWNDVVTEAAIQHSEWFMVGPVKRLAMMTVQMAMQVHAVNKAAIAEMRGVGQEPSDKLKEEAEDL